MCQLNKWYVGWISELFLHLSSRYFHHLDAAGESEQLCEPLHLPVVQWEASQRGHDPDV